MELIKSIYRAAVDSVLPNKLVQEALKIVKSSDIEMLQIKSCPKQFKLHKNVYVVAFGKAACGMSSAAETVLSEHLVKGIASIPVGSIENLRRNQLQHLLPMNHSKIEFCEGANNNIPDEAANTTALKVKELCAHLSSSDLLLVLISGGGSALLPCPTEEITLHEKADVINLLGRSGADIFQLNTVRQHLSDLKGGKLAQLAFPASVVTLIFSDIVGNDLQFVASGPTVPCTTSPKDAIATLERFSLKDRISNNIFKVLYKNAEEKNKSVSFDHVSNILLADNRVALEHGRMFAVDKNIPSFVVTNDISGNAATVGRMFARFLSFVLTFASTETDIDRLHKEFGLLLSHSSKCSTAELVSFFSRLPKNNRRFCLLWGGETTVDVKGAGKGGRNQELVLAFMNEMRKIAIFVDDIDLWFCSAGTDGQDGPTDAAGAFVDKSFLQVTGCADDEIAHLKNNDSYAFFDKHFDGRFHFKPGLTGTNVMDIQMLIVIQK